MMSLPDGDPSGLLEKLNDLPPVKPITGGLLTCDGNCHKPIEQGGAKPCNCPCCRRYG